MRPIKIMKSPETSLNWLGISRSKWIRKFLILSARLQSLDFFQALRRPVTKMTYCEAQRYGLYTFYEEPASTALTACIQSSYWSYLCQKEGIVTSRYEYLNYFLEDESTVDKMLDTKANDTDFVQVSNKPPAEYTEALWIKGMRCIWEAVLKGIFIEWLTESIHHCIP